MLPGREVGNLFSKVWYLSHDVLECPLDSGLKAQAMGYVCEFEPDLLRFSSGISILSLQTKSRALTFSQDELISEL